MATISVRINESLKLQAEQVANSIGLPLSSVINIFLHKFVSLKGFPFEVKLSKRNKEERKMNPENKTGVIDRFEIPDELARELSELLTKQTIRERLLLQLMNDPEKFEQAENMLVPITARIEAIKHKITNEYIPAQYQFPQYMWNYDGYEVDGNKLQILYANQAQN